MDEQLIIVLGLQSDRSEVKIVSDKKSPVTSYSSLIQKQTKSSDKDEWDEKCYSRKRLEIRGIEGD